jgi:glycosyltransferase involved in cell wall biosynthesis
LYSTVTIGCPIRNREKYITPYLECIKKINYPLDKITLLFVLNDSNDNTGSILNSFKKNNSYLFHKIKILTYNQNTPEDARVDSVRKKYTYNSLSKLRNYWLSQIKTDYAFSIDSDIMIKPNSLQKLLSHNKDYVAGLIINGYLFDPKNPYKYTNMLHKTVGGYKHINTYNDNEILEVDFTGAVMLLSRIACRLGRFGYHEQGEDQVFCESLQKNGIKLYVDTSVKCTHCMSEEYLEKYINGDFVW